VISASLVKASLAGNLIMVEVQFKNTGDEIARNLTINRVTTMVLEGEGGLLLKDPTLPFQVGNIDKGKTANVTFVFQSARANAVWKFVMDEIGTVQDAVGWPYPVSAEQDVTAKP